MQWDMDTMLIDVEFIKKITNTVNGKAYIGQSVNIDKRWKEHVKSLNNNDSRCTLLQRAWNKYGQEAFNFEILELCSKEMLDEIEIKYINLYDSCNNGYNIETGGNKNKRLADSTKQKIGDANRGRIMSNETRKKMSESRIGNKNGMYGKHHSEEAKRKMTNARLGKQGHPCSEELKEFLRQKNLGKVLSEETKRKISEAAIGREPYNKNKKAVYCVELNKVFYNPTAAGKEFNIRSSNIINCCNHIRKTCGGYHWEYATEEQYADFMKTSTIQN